MSEPITNAAEAVRELGALPMPVGPERLTPQERDMVLSLIGAAKPAASSLLVSFGESVRNRREHDHPKWEDFYCLNLSSYMGERMGPVLRRLVDVEAENEQLRTRIAEAVATVARQAQKITKLERIANAERARVVELEAVRRSVDAQFPKVAEFLAEEPPLTVYRASHDAIVLGRYRNKDAARLHCDTLMLREKPTAVLDWIEDDEDGIDELVATVGRKEIVTGYIVTALEIASEYDAEADE
ncbi:hypothetical protein [Streptomyces sp. NBC_00258]|uniref:hypothetical protein n=1 Tax=Streptomyces sp. NBC_00258 TaxID=2903642 RepID=UPI002E2C918A|nr:hypothetical protein [Streptomyces sp. NBC_00258]